MTPGGADTVETNMHMLQDFRTYNIFAHFLPPFSTQHLVR